MTDNHHDDICQNCGNEMNKSEPTLFHERHLGHIKAVEPDSNTIWSCGDCVDEATGGEACVQDCEDKLETLKTYATELEVGFSG